MVDEMLETALYGFHSAKSRYDEHKHDSTPLDVIVPLAEALWWATSLDEALGRDATYEQRRDGGDHSGQHVRAVRFARNRINHQLVLAIERVEGAKFPINLPMSFFEYLWRPTDQLPKGRPDPDGEKFYVQHLAGQPHASMSARSQTLPIARSASGVGKSSRRMSWWTRLLADPEKVSDLDATDEVDAHAAQRRDVGP